METNIRYTIVGGFVIILISFVILSVIWLSAGFSLETYDFFKVYMKESVGGLSIDGTVEFNGVNVGTVKDIRISEKDPELVELLLRVKSTTPISQGTTATMNMRGLTGVTYIALRDKGTNRQPLKLLPGEKYLVINTSPSLLMRFDQALTDMSQSFHNVSDSIEKLLSNDNLQSIKDILKNLQKITIELTPMMQKGFQVMETFNQQTLPSANQAIGSLDGILNNMTAISNELKQNPSVLIRGKTTGPLGPGEI